MLLYALCLLVAVVADDTAAPSGDIMNVHPDGTPEQPKELKEFLMSWKGDLVKAYGQKVSDAVFADDLDAFTQTFQEHNHKFIFHEDGSAKDIVRWRDNVREDEFYSKLLLENAPDVHRTITDTNVPDEEVQDLLRRQQRAYADYITKENAQPPKQLLNEQSKKFNGEFKPPKQEL